MREFAEANFMARVRCVLPRDQVNENGMPLSTASMDEWEDKVLAELGGRARPTEVAVVTGAGVRDLFFAAVEGDGTCWPRSAMSKATSPSSFSWRRSMALAKDFLNSLSPPQ